MLDETPKVNQLEDDRFNRMEHFYGSDELDPETLEDLELGDDGKVKELILCFRHQVFLFRRVTIRKICFTPIEKNSILLRIMMRANIRM